MRKTMVALLAGAMMMMATSAMALPLSLTVSDGVLSTTIVDNAAGDLDLNVGSISFINLALGTYKINVNSATGLGQPNIAWPEALHLNAVEVKTASVPNGTLTFTLKDSSLSLLGLLPVSPNAELEYFIGATTQNGNIVSQTVKYNGTAVGTQSGVAANRAFNADDFVLLDVANPFQIEEVVNFAFVTTGSSSFDAGVNIIPTPEPGTMVLLGLGMLGMAVFGKRRMNKEA